MHESGWIRRYMAHEVEDSGPRGRSKKTWKEVVDSDLNYLHFNAFDALDHKNGRN